MDEQESMTVEKAIEIIQGGNYLLGQCSGLVEAARFLHKKSALLWSRHNDSEARSLRDLGDELVQIEHEKRSTYDAERDRIAAALAFLDRATAGDEAK